MKSFSHSMFKTIFIFLFTLILPFGRNIAQPLDYKGKISLIASGSGSYVMESGVGIRYFTLETGIYPGYYLTNRFLVFGGFSHFAFSNKLSLEKFNINTLSAGGRYYFFNQHGLFLEANLSSSKVLSDSGNFGVIKGGFGAGINFLFVRPTFGGNMSLELVFKFNSVLSKSIEITDNEQTYLNVLGSTIGLKYNFPSLSPGKIRTKGNANQPSETQSLHYIRLIDPFTSVFYSYEKAAHPKFTIVTSIGLRGLNFLFSNDPGIYLQGMVEPRYVYGMQNRKSRNQVTVNNSSDYLGLEFGLRKPILLDGTATREDLLIYPSWGMRRCLSRNLFIDFNFGAQLYYWQMKSIEIIPKFSFSLNFVLAKRMKTSITDL